MSYYLNIVTLYLHGGYPRIRTAKERSREYFNRMLMAKQLCNAAGVTGFKFFHRYYDAKSASNPEKTVKNADISWGMNLKRRLSIRENSEIIFAVEKKLRFLENRRVIRISGGKIYFTGKKVDLGQEGNGIIDVVKTMANAIADSAEGRVKSFRKQIFQALRRTRSDLFRHVEDLTEVEQKLPGRTTGFILNPLLHQESLDLSAAKVLHDLNDRGAVEACVKTMRRHPNTRERIKFLIRAMNSARKEKPGSLINTFHPASRDFRTAALPDSPFDGFSLDYPGEKGLAFVISDLHLAGERHARTDDLLRFYGLARDLEVPVVHNGDHYDLFAYRSDIQGIWGTNRNIFLAADCVPGIVQIPGNHDSAIKEPANAKLIRKSRINVSINEQGYYFDGRVYIEHGHQADRHNVEGTKRGFYIVRALSYIGQIKLVRKYLPNFVRWVELLERGWFWIKSIVTGRDEWRTYKRDAVLDRVRKVFSFCSKERERMGLPLFSEKDPLIYIRGHDHGAGFFYTIDEIIKAVYYDPELAGRARYFNSGSWKGDDADFLAIDYSQLERVYVYPFVWRPTYNRFVSFSPLIRKQKPSWTGK